MMEAEHPQCSAEAAEQHHRQKQRPFRNPPRPAFGAPLIYPHKRKREGIDRQQVHPNQIQQPILHNCNLPRGSASGLRKGVSPLTLSRDWVGDFSILLPRVAQGFRLCGGDSPCVKAINFNKKIKPEHAHRWIPSGDKLPLRHRRDSPVRRAVHPPMCPAQRQFRVA